MHKVIEKIEAYKERELTKAIDKLGLQYAEAKGNFYDTGYERYYNKMMRVDDERAELREYRDQGKLLVEEQERVADAKRELERIKETLKSKLGYLLADLPDCPEAIKIRRYIDEYL